jgi:hypothetical protein
MVVAVFAAVLVFGLVVLGGNSGMDGSVLDRIYTLNRITGIWPKEGLWLGVFSICDKTQISVLTQSTQICEVTSYRNQFGSPK